MLNSPQFFLSLRGSRSLSKLRTLCVLQRACRALRGWELRSWTTGASWGPEVLTGEEGVERHHEEQLGHKRVWGRRESHHLPSELCLPLGGHSAILTEKYNAGCLAYLTGREAF